MNEQQAYALDHPLHVRDALPEEPQAFTRVTPAGRYGAFAVTITVEADERTIREWWRPCWHASCAAYFRGRAEPLKLEAMPLEMRQYMWRLVREALAGVGDDHPERSDRSFQRQRFPDTVHGRKGLSNDELRQLAAHSTA